MRKNDFENLTESVRQAGAIRRGEARPTRVTTFAPVDVKAIRQRRVAPWWIATCRTDDPHRSQQEVSGGD
jgi:hypothetical protein